MSAVKLLWHRVRVDRRGFLLTLAAGTMVALSGCDSTEHRARAKPSPTSPSPSATGPVDSATPSFRPSPSPSAARGSSLPDATGTWRIGPDGRLPSMINSLPGSGRDLALTVDDGTSSEVVGAYVDFLEASGVRLTFFVNGINPSWTDHAARLRPLVESGQVQLGNHTWSHPDITKLSDRGVADEATRNAAFITNRYGTDARPFFRPPFGYRTPRTDRVLAGLGYTTQVLWYGSFADSALISEAQLMDLARQWLVPQRIVIGHANHPTITHLYGQILDLITERQLRTVTLDDAFVKS